MSDSTKTVELTIETSNHIKKLSVNAGAILLEELIANGIGISSECGGYGICTTCRIICKEGLENFAPRTETESERAEERSFSPEERLSCQTEILGSAFIFIPDSAD